MRTLALVLSGNSEIVDKKISMAAVQTKPRDLRNFAASNLEAVTDASHTIVTTWHPKQPQPNESKYLSDDIPEQVIVSPIVMSALLHAHGKAIYSKLVHLLAIFSSIPEARASAGWIWEHWANAQISGGGDFILKPITFKQPTGTTTQSEPTSASDTTGPISIRIPPLKISLFDVKTRLSVTCNSDYYFIPASKNNATFDAFFHHKDNGIGLQMTLSDNHSLNADGLKKLYDRLQARKETQHIYVVVVRKGHTFKNFKPTPTPIQQKRFRFFTLELELPPGMCLFLP